MSEWTTMNPPANRSKDNTRASILLDQPNLANTSTLSPSDIETLKKQQPPFYLLLQRTSATTVELSHALTNELLYKIRDTGRGSLSSKPDYEIWRQQGKELFVGSIRFGRRGTEIKLPVSGTKIDDPEAYASTAGKVKWSVTSIGRTKGADGSYLQQSESSEPLWVAVLDCVVDGEKVGTVKLLDGLPNGRFEVWNPKACVDVGGDWAVLDEIVTVGYANMEKARRKVMTGKDPTSIGIAGVGMSAIGGS